MWLPSCIHPSTQCVIGGVMIHLVLGSLYLWGNITVYVTSYLRQFNDDIEFSDTLIVYAATLFGQCCFMPIGGILESKYGLKKVLFTAQCIQTMALLMASQATQLWQMILAFYTFGIHTGLAYSCPLAAGYQWLPKQKGFVSGFVLAGYGCNALIFNQVTTFFMNPDNVNPHMVFNGKKYFDEDIAGRTPEMFYLLAICYFCLFSLGACLVRYPNEEEKLKIQQELGNNDEKNIEEPLIEKDDKKKEDETVLDETKVLDVPTSQVLFEPVLWNLGLSFVFCSIVGTVILGTYKSIGMDYFHDDKYLATVGSLAAFGNCLGRVFWGYLSDKIGFQRTMYLISLGVFISILLYSLCTESQALFAIGTFLIIFCHSGNFPLYPAGAAGVFGAKYSGGNIGLMYLVFGAFSMVGIFYIPKIDVEFNLLCYLLAFVEAIGFVTLLIMAYCTIPSYMIQMKKKMFHHENNLINNTTL